MKFSRSDLLTMRRSILAVCASSLASMAILYSSSGFVESAQDERRNAQRIFNSARDNLATALQDRENMAIYAGEYGTLVEHKIIGDDQRLDWIEGLEKIRQQALVMDFRYNIAPQRPYTVMPPVDSGNFDIHYSEMTLQLDLLHEGQLLNFFDALRTSIKGRYQLDGCTIQRIGADNENEQAARIHLKAECNGGWITLKNRSMP